MCYILELQLTLKFQFLFSLAGLPRGVQKVLQSKGKNSKKKHTDTHTVQGPAVVCYQKLNHM